MGKRKAAPRKKSARASTGGGGGGGGGVVRKDSKSAAEMGGAGDADVEVDDDGNVIDQDEPRYCLCNRVSFGTMIQCDNDVSLSASSLFFLLGEVTLTGRVR